MEESARGRPDANSPDSGGEGSVRAPTKGESSSSDAVPPSDAPTSVDLPSPPDPFDSPTLGDVTIGPDAPSLRKGGPLLKPPAPTARGQRPLPVPAVLETGQVLAERYEILHILGVGGMGAVYQAKDRALDRAVAIKVIRPDLAGSRVILERFKQELLLAREVTHKNVIRIYDLGEANGLNFITMEYVEGENLRTLIQERAKLPPEEAVDIMLQVCRALEAAHSAGIVHRDLKPQNVMRDKSGRILVMDFGLARTLEGDGMTQTGALVGTMDYMSPEQALGKELDQRSDLFALGLIFYELLTGKMPYKADSLVASLLKRTQERAIPVVEHDSTIPEVISSIVSKCLEPDLKLRYQTVQEILSDLEAWQGKGAAATLRFPSAVTPWGRTFSWHWIGALTAALALAIMAFLLRHNLFKPSPSPETPAGPVVSLAIMPFRNASGDSGLDWLGPSMADMLSTDVGQSSQLRTVSPDSLHRIFTDLRISPAVLDPPTIRRVAHFSNAERVVWGQFAKFGDQIRIDATLEDIKSDRTVPLKVDVANMKEMPGAIDRLADSIRQKLALPENVIKELKASSFQPTSQSVIALRDYNQGIGFQRDGKNLEAVKQFEAATQQDPSFALAFSKLAQTYSSLGYDDQAEQSAKRAEELSQNLPEAERYLIAAIHAQITRNFPQAIKAYENLVKASPGNTDAQATLAGLYEEAGDLAKAGEYNKKILDANPNDIGATLAVGRLAINSGVPQASLDPLNRALSLSMQLGNQQQESTSYQLLGTACRMLNKPEEALRYFREALLIRRQIGDKRLISSSLNGIATIEASLGKNKDALAHFQEALQIRSDIGDKRGQGESLIELGNFYDDSGDHDQALKMYTKALQFERDVGNEALQAACLNNIGAVYFAKAQYEDARIYYQQALELHEKLKVPQDIVESIHNLAETSVRMGEYDQALSQYMRALELRRSMNDNRGAAIESYTIGMMFDQQGRFGAAVTSKQEALKTFTDLKDKTYWMAEIQGGYGEALILAGRGDEANGYLNDALSLSRMLKNEGMVSQTLAFQGDAAYYRGNSKSAHAFYEQALRSATRSKEPDKILIAKVELAKVAMQEGHGPQAITSLRLLAQQAEDLGFKYLALECSVSEAEAMMQTQNNAHAREELERVLLRVDRVGLKPLSAKAHYLLATILRANGNQTQAQEHYRDALELIDGMRKDPGADKILERSDFKTMYDEATRWTHSAQS
jgi:eukaryotic-like serine/threonine-protein kinase